MENISSKVENEVHSMRDVYEYCPEFENDKYLLRLISTEDTNDLLKVYSDASAVPFFNGDNCNGDDFYYKTLERMKQAVDFWIFSYNERYFVRWTIIDKTLKRTIGTIELFHREADDDFNHAGVLRLDLGSEFEEAGVIRELLQIIIPPAFDLFDCGEIITKVPLYAIERAKAVSKVGFERTERLLVGTMDGYAYKDYWTIKR